jgi:Tfp pilus assembly protein PilF
MHDARRVVVTALAADRDEPTLHLLLGDLYTRTGLTDLAAESFDEAQYLTTK